MIALNFYKTIENIIFRTLVILKENNSSRPCIYISQQRLVIQVQCFIFSVYKFHKIQNSTNSYRNIHMILIPI